MPNWFIYREQYFYCSIRCCRRLHAQHKAHFKWLNLRCKTIRWCYINSMKYYWMVRIWCNVSKISFSVGGCLSQSFLFQAALMQMSFEIMQMLKIIKFLVALRIQYYEWMLWIFDLKIPIDLLYKFESEIEIGFYNATRFLGISEKE